MLTNLKKLFCFIKVKQTICYSYITIIFNLYDSKKGLTSLKNFRAKNETNYFLNNVAYRCIQPCIFIIKNWISLTC